jgi:hypothetical protein
MVNLKWQDKGVLTGFAFCFLVTPFVVHFDFLVPLELFFQ